MLVLSRDAGEALILKTASGERIRIVNVNRFGHKMRVGIDAPDSVRILREELPEFGHPVAKPFCDARPPMPDIDAAGKVVVRVDGAGPLVPQERRIGNDSGRPDQGG